nr:GNAT family N-acetyltransferase [Actinomycetales bacterium]
MVPQPPSILHRTFLPSGDVEGGPLLHRTLAGRSADGSLIAIGTVRVADEGDRRMAAVRAIIAPSWRGRGIGRALLSWQDATALLVLVGAPGEPGVIGVPIAASMVDRRRLYTAAGFSAATRLEVVRRHLGDSPLEGRTSRVHGEAAPGWCARPLESGDTDAVLELLRDLPDPHAFLMHALTHAELLALVEPGLSRVVLEGDTVRGYVLVVPLASRPGADSAVILAISLPGAAPEVRDGVLADTSRTLWSAGYREVMLALTPARAREWARSLTAQSFQGIASDPLYTIELH